ncbi:MAG: hypothetical protein K0Q97_2112 [Bacillota bacterium]|nr:hypothetical protein [Bacillota bacterium]
MNYNNDYQMLLKCENNIRYYQQMIATNNDPCQRIMYENMLNKEKNRYYQIYNQLKNNMSSIEENGIYKSDIKQFTIEELSQYDGSNGKPAYVAVNGIVYDVSIEATWGGGTHFSMYAGQDLSAQFNGCHGGRIEILRNLPRVGFLISR